MLRAVIKDDERPAVDELSYLLGINAVEVIGSFLKTEGALDFIVREKPDIVFLDIEMRGKNGIDFGVELKNCASFLHICFLMKGQSYTATNLRGLCSAIIARKGRTT